MTRRPADTPALSESVPSSTLRPLLPLHLLQLHPLLAAGAAEPPAR